MTGAVGNEEFRRTLGDYPTGVSLVTARDDQGDVAMVVGSFTSISLDPPLVGFFPGKKSTSWPRIAQAETFCINVLTDQQADVCNSVMSKSEDAFTGLSWTDNLRVPRVDASLCWLTCKLEETYEIGDHFLAVGRVFDIETREGCAPLLFYKGRYRRIKAAK